MKPKEINLFSPTLEKKIAAKKFIKVPTWLVGIFGLLFFTIVVSIVMFFTKVYYDIQVTEKGNKLIELRNNQAKYNTIIDSIDKYNARKSSITAVNRQIVKFDKVLLLLDQLTKNTVLNYTIDKTTGEATIRGVVKTVDEASNITEQMRKSEYFSSVKLDKVIRRGIQDVSYDYDILFRLNNEKVQTL